jgi:hypothetical protein
MARVHIAVNEVAYWDKDLARRYEEEIGEAAAPAAEPGSGGIECRILVDGYVDLPAPRYADLQFAIPGWVTRFSLPFRAAPGEVRETVERVFRYRGMLPR